MNAAEAFVERWSKVWRGPDSDPQLYMELQARGIRSSRRGVARAHEELVAEGGNSFRPQDPGARLGNVVKFRWEVVTGGGEVAGVGLEFVVLGVDGRIQTDYQYIES
jgi:hypothetical protein